MTASDCRLIEDYLPIQAISSDLPAATLAAQAEASGSTPNE